MNGLLCVHQVMNAGEMHGLPYVNQTSSTNNTQLQEYLCETLWTLICSYRNYFL